LKTFIDKFVARLSNHVKGIIHDLPGTFFAAISVALVLTITLSHTVLASSSSAATTRRFYVVRPTAIFPEKSGIILVSKSRSTKELHVLKSCRRSASILFLESLLH